MNSVCKISSRSDYVAMVNLGLLVVRRLCEAFPFLFFSCIPPENRTLPLQEKDSMVPFPHVSGEIVNT